MPVLRSTAWVALAALAAAAAAPAPAAEAADPEREKLLYAIGVIVGRRLTEFQLSDEELEIVERGLRDVAMRRELFVNENFYRKRITKFAKERGALRLAMHKRASERFLERAGEAEGAVRTPAGVIVTELRPGRGGVPSARDVVRVHFHGRLYDGSVFDSSVERGEPELQNLARAGPCWRDGLQRMRVGGKSRIVCSSELAYGDKGTQTVPGGAAIVLEVELLEIVR